MWMKRKYEGLRVCCYDRLTGSSEPCDQQHNCQAGGEARLNCTIDGARIGLH
jgi:hypothetical protein